jgi:Fe-S-cluster containining protein
MLSKKASERLSQIYQRLDGEIAGLGLTCRACGRCCDFDTSGVVLYVSRIEFDYLSKEAPPITPEAGKNRCPYLMSSGRCGIHRVRPLGCRTFFCDFGDKDAMQTLYHKYFSEIKSIHVAGEDWRYQSLFEFLNGPRPGCAARD